MFDRTANLANNQIINYKCDSSEKWLVLIGIAPGSPEVLRFFIHSSVLVYVYTINYVYYMCTCTSLEWYGERYTVVFLGCSNSLIILNHVMDYVFCSIQQFL